MKKINSIVGLISMMVTLFIVMPMSVSAQAALLVSEVEFDAPNASEENCSYVELRGVPGSTVPAGYQFVTINGDSGSFGDINLPVNLAGRVVGSNGTITILNDLAGVCQNRVYGAGTTIVITSNFSGLGQGAETYAIVSRATVLIEGDDIDLNNDRVIDPASGVTVIDGFGVTVNQSFQATYAPNIFNAATQGGGSIDLPDAATRFANNNIALLGGAFYFGELADTPDESVTYVAGAPTTSANLPTGAVLTPGAANVGVQKQTPYDFDGDFKADQAVFRNGVWYILRSSSLTGGFSAVQFGLATDRIAPADYDGDSRTDIAVFRDGTWYILQSSNNAFVGVQFGLAGDFPVPADYDGDLRADIAVWRPGTTGTFYILQSQTGTARIVDSFGLATDIPLVGDFDGDGRADPAVYRGGTGGGQSFFYYIASANNPSSNTTFVPFGTTGDRPVVADYDGDARTDVAVYRAGVWYALLSSTGQLFSIQFGLPTDIPVPADYNGDGRADQAVFRDGVWYANLSPSNTFFAVQFGTTGDRPVPAAYIP